MARTTQASKIGIWADPSNVKLETCLFFTECECDICKKHFEADVQLYQWKRNNPKGTYIYYCSYTCFRKWEKKELAKNQKRIRKEMWEAEHLYTENGEKISKKKSGRPRKVA